MCTGTIVILLDSLHIDPGQEPSSTSLYCKNTLTQRPCFVSGTVCFTCMHVPCSLIPSCPSFFSPIILQTKKSWDGWVQGCAWCSLGHLKSTIASKRGGSECPQGVTFQVVYQNGAGWEYQMHMTTLNT